MRCTIFPMAVPLDSEETTNKRLLFSVYRTCIKGWSAALISFHAEDRWRKLSSNTKRWRSCQQTKQWKSYVASASYAGMKCVTGRIRYGIWWKRRLNIYWIFNWWGNKTKGNPIIHKAIGYSNIWTITFIKTKHPSVQNGRIIFFALSKNKNLMTSFV